MTTQGNIGIVHPDCDADFYGDMVQEWWTVENAVEIVGKDLWPQEDHPVRLTRITKTGGAYAPLHGTFELFEAHLGLWKPGGWVGDVTFRKVETDTIPLARGYARDVTNRMFSGPNSSLITYGHFPHVPNTLFFWATPDKKSVSKHVEAQADGWRRYARNRYEEDQAAWQAEIAEAERKEKSRQRLAAIEERVALANQRHRVLTEADRQKRVEQQVETSIRQHGGEDAAGVPPHIRKPTAFRTAEQRESEVLKTSLSTPWA